MEVWYNNYAITGFSNILKVIQERKRSNIKMKYEDDKCPISPYVISISIVGISKKYMGCIGIGVSNYISF